jgi:hypothetical protein
MILSDKEIWGKGGEYEPARISSKRSFIKIWNDDS